MRFNKSKTYTASVYDKDDRFIVNVFGLHFDNKAHVLKWARFIAKKNKRTFGHVSICDDETSIIVRYTPSGKIWDVIN